MVSIDPSSVSISSGARFFTENMSAFGEPIQSMEDPILSTEHGNNFKRIRTIPFVSLHLLISTAISVAGIVLAIVWTDQKRCEAYFIMLFCRAAYWLITFIITYIVKYQHHHVRMKGYHEFHKITKKQKVLPLYIVSLSTAVILAVQTLLHDLYGDNFGEHCVEKLFSPIVYITGISATETFILAAVEISYMIKICNFNRLQAPPDALTERLSGGTVGFIQPGANTAELLEAQADLISYYKEQNSQLKMRLMQLSSQMNQSRRNEHI